MSEGYRASLQRKRLFGLLITASSLKTLILMSLIQSNAHADTLHSSFKYYKTAQEGGVGYQMYNYIQSIGQRMDTLNSKLGETLIDLLKEGATSLEALIVLMLTVAKPDFL